MSWIARLHDIKNTHSEAAVPVFDTVKWQAEITSLARELGDCDPRSDCWEWVLTHKPHLWRDLISATKGIDINFAKRDSVGIAAAINTSRELFANCIGSWQSAREPRQGDLFD